MQFRTQHVRQPEVSEIVGLEIVLDDDRHPRNGVATTCTISWEHKQMEAGLDKMFNLKDYEQITAIEVTQHGIKATIVRKAGT